MVTSMWLPNNQLIFLGETFPFWAPLARFLGTLVSFWDTRLGVLTLPLERRCIFFLNIGLDDISGVPTHQQLTFGAKFSRHQALGKDICLLYFCIDSSNFDLSWLNVFREPMPLHYNVFAAWSHFHNIVCCHHQCTIVIFPNCRDD